MAPKRPRREMDAPGAQIGGSRDGCQWVRARQLGDMGERMGPQMLFRATSVSAAHTGGAHLPCRRAGGSRWYRDAGLSRG